MNSKNKQNLRWYWAVFSILLVALTVIQYYGIVKYHYVAPAGDDPVNHYTYAKPFYDGTQGFLETWKSGSYPPLYHYTVAHIARTFNIDLLATINWTYPSIIIFAALSIFIAVYFILGPIEALIGFFLYGLTAKSSIQLLMDGGYPNLIAAHILLPLFVLFYAKIFLSKKLKQQIIFLFLSIFFALLIVLTHHISTFYLFGIIGLSLPFIVVWSWIYKGWRPVKGIFFSALAIIFFATGIYTFFKTDLLAPVLALYRYGSAHFDPSGIWSIKSYPVSIGATIALLGLIGTIILVYKLVTSFKSDLAFKAIVILSWLLLLFVGSRIKMANPERMARDLVVPLTILAGFGVVYLARWIKIRWIKIILLLFLLTIVSIQLKSRIVKATRYEPMIRHTSANEEIMAFLSNKPGAILTNQLDHYAPLLYSNRVFEYSFIDTVSPTYVKKFRYIIITTRQDGWLPGNFHLGVYDNMSALNFKKVGEFDSPINDLELFERITP